MGAKQTPFYNDGRGVVSAYDQAQGAPTAKPNKVRFSPHPWPGWKAAAGVFSAVLYGSVAVAMNFVNKYTLMVFPLATIVLLLQMVAAYLIIHPLHLLGYIEFPAFTWAKCRRLLPITLLYTGNTAFALFGLKSLSIPMYSTLKRLTPMIVLVSKALVTRKWPSATVTGSVVLVVVGCIVAGVGDLSFQFNGYLYALCSCVAQAAYLLLVEFSGDEGISTSELLYYNALTTTPLLAIMCFLSGELAALPPLLSALSTARSVSHVATTVAACALSGCLLNYSLFLCTIHNSALTTTIVGVLKGVLAVVLGFFLLGGVKVSALNVAGISLNTLGAAAYAAATYAAKRPRLARATVASASADPLRAVPRPASSASLAALAVSLGVVDKIDRAEKAELLNDDWVAAVVDAGRGGGLLDAPRGDERTGRWRDADGR